MLKIRNLEAGYDKLKVLKGISLHVKQGEIVTIIGANGAGKSTLLNTIASLVKTDSGEIILRDRNVAEERADYMVKNGCALVPEGRQLYPAMTVRENLILGAYTAGRRRKRETERKLDEMFTMFPVLGDRRTQLAGTLSGGEQQMAAIGRALMSDPQLLMMDEPSMAWRRSLSRISLQQQQICVHREKTILIVEQNAKAVLEIADRGYVMETEP